VFEESKIALFDQFSAACTVKKNRQCDVTGPWPKWLFGKWEDLRWQPRGVSRMGARRRDTLGGKRGLVVHGLTGERPQFSNQTKLRVLVI
jgi:hypothetical protein